MNFFCRIFGHTWWPEVVVPDHHWNTTKDGNILVPTIGEQSVRHIETCKRCGTERTLAPRRHDADGLAPVESAGESANVSAEPSEASPAADAV